MIFLSGVFMFYTVQVPVCDLRREPIPFSPHLIKDPLQESQVLYGETVVVKTMREDWAYVEVHEQKKCIKNQWVGYPGWVHFSHLIPYKNIPFTPLIVSVSSLKVGSHVFSYGSLLRGIKRKVDTWTVLLLDQTKVDICQTHVNEFISKFHFTHSDRYYLLKHACRFLGSPYLWGGRSAFIPSRNQKSSVDCSGFTQLLYRSQGVIIPRDAQDQYLQCKKIEFKDLLKADLIFTSERENPEIMTHVMLFNEGDSLIESCLTGGGVRFITGREKFGKALNQIRCGEFIHPFHVWFGSFNP